MAAYCQGSYSKSVSADIELTRWYLAESYQVRPYPEVVIRVRPLDKDSDQKDEPRSALRPWPGRRETSRQ